MSTPLLSKLKSVLLLECDAAAPSAGPIPNITASSVTQSTIVSDQLAGVTTDNSVLLVYEALDGNVKGQMVVGLSNSGTNTVTTTNFSNASPTATQFKQWNFNISRAPITATTINQDELTAGTLIGDGDDYWEGWRILGVNGNIDGDLLTVDAFTSATGLITSNADFSAIPATANHDHAILCYPMQPSSFEMSVSAGQALEREIVTDTLATEGVIVGSQEGSTVSMDLEIRGPGTIGASGTGVKRPDEAGRVLKMLHDEKLGTGGAADVVSSATYWTLSAGAFSQYTINMVNGECCVNTLAGTSAMGTYAGHVSAAPQTGDVVYAGASYHPKDTGHISAGFLVYHGDSEMALVAGGLPSLGVSLEGDQIAKYNFSYPMSGGLWSTDAKQHDDVYDTTAPIPVKSNVSRVVLGGTELDADVMSVSIELLPEPEKKGANFGAFEGSGGHFYTNRQPSVTMEIYFEDSSYYHKYRKSEEFDMLIQVGSVPGNTWAFWAPRAQLVQGPEISGGDNLMTQTLTFRLLRPSTAGQPDYVIAHV